MITPILVEISEPSQIGEARRLGQKMAASCGFNEVQEGRISLIITEAATNIVRYGDAGCMILQPCLDEGEAIGLEILALDRGPGMHDVPSCMMDGYSTGATQGTGLGAIKRLADQFDIYSAPGQGTAILCRVFLDKDRGQPEKNQAFSWGAVSIPYPGEDICGDMWSAHVADGLGVFLVADGLGHGVGAAEAAREAAAVLQDIPQLNPEKILERCNGRMRSTRGAAAAVASIDMANGRVRYAGIGNIVSCLKSTERSQHLVSHPGILGHATRKFQEFTYDWQSDTILVMQSDGLSSRCDLSPYPGLSAHDPTLMAGVLFRDYRRGRDDATVLCVRRNAFYSGPVEWTIPSLL